jgi:hypothetical protein
MLIDYRVSVKYVIYSRLSPSVTQSTQREGEDTNPSIQQRFAAGWRLSITRATEGKTPIHLFSSDLSLAEDYP